MATWNILSFQDRNSPIIEQLLFFHDHRIIILILITILTLYVMIYSIKSSYYNRFLLDGHDIEVIWTVLPTFMLIFIAMPSLKTLYIMEEIAKPTMSLKAIGHQWYWSYEYSDFVNKEMDAFLEESKIMRLLNTSTNILVPNITSIRLIVSSADVIHSWTIPSLGVKVDALPGRLNQLYFNIKRTRLLTGQCSEICGANHSFIPIVIESINYKYFLNYMKRL